MKNNETSSSPVQKNSLEDIGNKYVLFIFEDLVNIDELKQMRNSLSRGGFNEVGDISVSFIDEKNINTTELKNKVHEAIYLVKQKGAFLLFSHFTPFEKDIHLSTMEILSNSGIQFRFHDFLSINKENFKVLIETYKRRKSSGRRESDSTARVKHATNTLNNKPNKLKTKRKKNQKVYLDINNRKVLHELIKLKNTSPKLTDTYIAQLLTEKNILTPRGHLHTQKSVSRKKEQLEKLEERFSLGEGKFKTTVAMQVKEDYAMDIAIPSAPDTNIGSAASHQEAPPRESAKTDTPDKASAKEALKSKMKKEFPIEISTENDSIFIQFGEEWKEDLKMSILIYSPLPSEKEFAYKKEGSLPKEWKLSLIDKDCFLLPGVHFVVIQIDGYELIKKKISIMPSLNPNINQENIKWGGKLEIALNPKK